MKFALIRPNGVSRPSCLFSIRGLYTGNGPFDAAESNSPLRIPFRNADPSGFDPVTGLYTRVSIEQHLGKEIGRARRENTSLSVATVHIDEFANITQRYGKSAIDALVKDFARRLKKAIRGSDFAVRLASGDFLLILTECTLGEVKHILDRLGPLEIVSAGEKNSIPYLAFPQPLLAKRNRPFSPYMLFFTRAASSSRSLTPAV